MFLMPHLCTLFTLRMFHFCEHLNSNKTQKGNTSQSMLITYVPLMLPLQNIKLPVQAINNMSAKNMEETFSRAKRLGIDPARIFQKLVRTVCYLPYRHASVIWRAMSNIMLASSESCHLAVHGLLTSSASEIWKQSIAIVCKHAEDSGLGVQCPS